MKRILLFLFLLVNTGFIFGQNGQIKGLKPVVKYPIYFDVSPPLTALAVLAPVKGDHAWKDGVVKNFFNVKKNKSNQSDIPNVFDPSVQDYMGMLPSDTTIQNWQGITNPNGYYPPDTHGDVGPNNYFQVVNASYRIWNKTGTALIAVTANSSMFTGLPNNSNDGDAVVLYDEQANRWLFSQFSLPTYPTGPFYQMIAVSQTPDPTGSWYRWEYSFTDMPDYPKFGVWPDGYYMSMNRFASGSGSYLGTGAVAYDRTAMLAGNTSPAMVSFTLPSSNEAFTCIPADCDGAFPPVGTPEYFTYINENPYHLRLYEFLVNWTTPSSSTYGNYTTLAVNTFTTSGLTGVPQLGTTRKIDPITDRLMYRVQFRKFSDHWSMVTNHTVNANVSSANNAGIRWYEMRKTTGAWSIYQQSTYAPDTKYRWMAGAAMDTSGNIALGYSISSSTMYPGIKYCGRMKNDAVNTMTIAEKGIINGGGSQTVAGNPSRWGDYSGLSVDPSAQATFWYTQEYYTTTSASNWTTRIASFSFSNSMSVTASATPSTINVGQSTQLNVVASGGTPPYSYSWTSVPAGFTSNLQTPPPVSPIVNTKYVAHVTGGTQTKTDTAYLTVNIGVVATATPSSINVGQTSQLNVTASGGTGIYTYSWTSIPVGFTSNLQTPPPVSPIINTKYIAHVTSGALVMTDTAKVTLGFSVLAASNPSNITAGQSSQLSAVPTGGSGTYSYSWTSIPAGFTSNMQNPIVYPTQTTQYIVSCNDGSLTRLDTTIVSVTLNILTAHATATPSVICAGQTSQLNVSATGGSLTYTYSWTSIPVGFTSNIQNPVVSPTVTTKYIAHVNDGYTSVNDTTLVTVTPVPSVAAGSDTTFCTWANQIPLHGTAASYSSVLWSTSGTGTFSSNSSLSTTYYPSAQDKTNAAVNLTLTAYPLSPCVNALSSTRHVLFDPCTGFVETGNDPFGISLNPNPTYGVFLLTIKGVKGENVKITIIDMEGQAIINSTLLSMQNTLVKKMDLSGYPKGAYIVKVQTDTQVKTEKIIVK